MKNLWLSSLRKISSTKRKFLSLLCLALLGVGFYAGIKATSPDMTDTLDNYLKEQNAYDLEVTSTLGLTSNDVKKIEELDLGTVTGSKYQDAIVTIEDQETVVKIIANNDVNKVILKEGDLPQKKDEIVVEELFLKDFDLEIGDTLEIPSDAFDNNTFKIVGVVESPLYFTSYRGTTSLGNGEWKYYFYVDEDAFNFDYYTDIYVNLDSCQDLVTNSEAYLDEVEKAKDKIEDIKDDQIEERYQELYGDIIAQLEMYHQPIPEDKFPRPVWYLFDRTDNDGYNTFIDASKSIDQIGSVFPLIFYVVAILISLISMSRMVEEERSELGTLKGLGFANHHIYVKNFLYAFLATTIGGILGMFIGFLIIPNVIWNIYTSMFKIPTFVNQFHFDYGLIGLIIAVICIGGASLATSRKILKEKPSELMRPKAPKIGKKIFLERFSFWNKLRFSTKISIRNVFRYKKRILITIIGIAGSTSLMLVGFGLKDSVTDIVELHDEIFAYDRLLYLKPDANLSNIKDTLTKNEDIETQVEARYEMVDISKDSDPFEVTLITPQDRGKIDEVIKLRDINNNKEKISLAKDKIVLSEKLAKSLDVKVGDVITIKLKDTAASIEVGAITENYIRDFAYMTKETYERLFNSYEVNSIFLRTGENYDKTFDKTLMKNDNVMNVISTEGTSELVNRVLDSLNSVVLVLIVASALLAFVILYNLSSINISERKREISTLKVLGFYDEEVDAYITNENYFITLVGILIGLWAGLYLCYYVISTCEPPFVMFVRNIKPLSYILTTIIAWLFTLVISRLTHYSLQKIDMVESLKSNE